MWFTYNKYIWYICLMPQIHCYVSKETSAQLKKRAESRGLSVSAYLRQLVAGEVQNRWPKGFFEEVVGGWKGKPLERPPQGDWDERESVDVLTRHERMHQDSE